MQIDKNNWQIKIDEDNLLEIRQFVENNKGIDGGSYGNYLICSQSLIDISSSNDVCIPIITTDQFRKYILGKEERKIKGYAAPFDMWDGKIRKGKLFIWDEDNKNNYKSEGGIYTFPSELVEPYFTPVYEEEKVIDLYGYRITKDAIISLMSDPIYTKESFLEDIERFKKWVKEYSEIIKAYEELNK